MQSLVMIPISDHNITLVLYATSKPARIIGYTVHFTGYQNVIKWYDGLYDECHASICCCNNTCYRGSMSAWVCQKVARHVSPVAAHSVSLLAP